MTLVREDAHGLYVKAGGVTARPGSINGYGHAYRMDDGNLKKGDKVTARHVGGTPMVKIKLPDGNTTRWFSEGATRDRDIIPADPNAQWDSQGCRVFSKDKSSKTQTRAKQIQVNTIADIQEIIGS